MYRFISVSFLSVVFALAGCKSIESMKNADQCWVFWSNSPFNATKVENGKVVLLGSTQAHIKSDGTIVTASTRRDFEVASVKGNTLGMHIIPAGYTRLTIANNQILTPKGKAFMGYNARCSVHDAGLGAAVSIMHEQRRGGRIDLD